MATDYLSIPANNPIRVTMARPFVYYYQSRGSKPEAWAYYFKDGTGADKVLYANKEVHAALLALEMHEGAEVELCTVNQNYRITLVHQGTGKEVALFESTPKNDQSETASNKTETAGEAAKTDAPPTQRKPFGPGTPAGDEGMYVEAIVSAHRVFSHPVVRYILHRHGYGQPTVEQLLTIATHFNIGRQQRGERSPTDEGYTSPPPEGRWDKLIEQLNTAQTPASV